MNQEEQIDYMIASLQLVKQEIIYAKKYNEQLKTDKDFWNYGHFGYDHNQPNGTIIRESLRMVGRLANRVANEVCLSSYNKDIFRQ